MSITHSLGFISTPYESDAIGLEHAYEAARDLTARLINSQPIAIFSPVVLCHPLAHAGAPDPRDRDFWMAFIRPLMTRCSFQVVAQLPNWENSEGIAAETGYFERAGLAIFDLDPVTLSMTRRRQLKPVRERIDNLPIDQVEADKRQFLGHSAR